MPSATSRTRLCPDCRVAMHHTSASLDQLLDPGQRERLMRRKGEDAVYKTVGCYQCPDCGKQLPYRIPEAAKAVADARSAAKAKIYPIRKIIDSAGVKRSPSFTVHCLKHELVNRLLAKFGANLHCGYRQTYNYWVEVPEHMDPEKHLAIFVYAHKTRRGFYHSCFLVRPRSIDRAKQGTRNFELEMGASVKHPPRLAGAEIYQ